MSKASENAVVAAVVAIVAGIVIGAVALAVVLAPEITRKRIENFKAESFARAVVAQNPKVFEKLAEM